MGGQEWAEGKADTWGKALKDVSAKGAAVYAKLFKDDGKMNFDGFKDFVKTMKFNADGSLKDKADQPEDVQLAIDNGVIDTSDPATIEQIDAIVEAQKLEDDAASSETKSDELAAAEVVSPAFM